MKKLYLLDAYALIYRGYYAPYQQESPQFKGHDTSAVLGFLNFSEDILKPPPQTPMSKPWYLTRPDLP